MKWLILLGFMQSVSATTLTQFYSSPDGSSEQRFEINQTSATYIKKSNFFDIKKSLVLGTFELDSTENVKSDYDKIEEILDKVRAVDKFLKTKNSSFNTFSQQNPHSSFIRLNDFRISQSSDSYPELKAIFNKLQEYKWKEKSAVKLSEDFKTISRTEAGKVTASEPFAFTFHCQKPQPPTVCSYKDFGILYVE